MKNFLFFAGNDINVSADDAGIPVISANDLVVNALSTIFLAAGTIAVVIIIISGFRYVVSRGDSGEVAKAKNGILYAVVGLVIALFAFAITRFVADAVVSSAENYHQNVAKR